MHVLTSVSPVKTEIGTLFPKDGSPAGTRTTTDTGKKVIQAALRAAGSSDAKTAADQIMNEKAWRFKYTKYYETLVRAGASDKDAAINSAKAGFDWIYDNFEFSKDGKITKFREAMQSATSTSLETGIIKGSKPKGASVYRVPFDGPWHPATPNPPAAGAVLEGPSLKAQLNKWSDKGIVEKDAADAIAWTSDYFNGKNDLSHCYFVMIGASSAMGPYAKLLEHGANIVALDIPGKWGSAAKPTIWRHLIHTAKESNGTVTFPLSKAQKECTDESSLAEAAGADLTVQPFEIAKWLETWAATIPKDAPIVIGNYTYFDADVHVKLSLCADVLIQTLRKVRPNTAVAFLGTPTDFHAIPGELSIFFLQYLILVMSYHLYTLETATMSE